ncbi:MAG: hypothetical protein K8S94_09535 [Planctomycetia bacterium]|nr:hypothetical protein [Planctomycetia bacterium]
MSSYDPELRDFLHSDVGLPVPDWDRVGEWVKLYVPPDDRYEVWTEFALQWFDLTNDQFDNRYEVLETPHFLLFGLPEETPLKSLGRFAEECRAQLIHNLPGLAKFNTPGKTVIFVFTGRDAYYAHVDDYHGDGEYGGSGGMHIRTRYSHVVIQQLRNADIFQVCAHELTHAAIEHFEMPLWLEEGLTQLFEHDLAGKPFLLEAKEVAEQKAYWRDNGLDEFWSGEGFSRPGDVQKYSYQLAEILLRLLLSDYRPRWLGFDRRPLVTLMNFIRHARRDDSGEEAAQEHLGLSLEDIAAKSLGRGGRSRDIADD